MPTQVRIFTTPRSLGETLAPPAEKTQTIVTPRSIPEYPEIPKPSVSPALKARQYAVMNGQEEEKPKGGVTYAHQDKLPKLPIPELERSCERYLEALRPLQSQREHAETQHAVREFLRGEGPELHERLKKYAEGKSSYIEQFCM